MADNTFIGHTLIKDHADLDKLLGGLPPNATESSLSAYLTAQNIALGDLDDQVAALADLEDKVARVVWANDGPVPAMGDGVSDDTAALQSKIDALAAVVSSGPGTVTGGGTLMLGDGRFLVSTLVLKYGVRIRGNGQKRTTLVIKPGSGAQAAVTVSSGIVAYSGLYNFSIEGAGAANPNQHGIYVRAVESMQSGFVQGGWWNSEIENIAIDGFYGEALWLHGGGDNFLAPIQFITIKQLEIDAPNAARKGIRMSGEVNQVDFTGVCRVNGAGPGSGGTCVLLERTVDVNGVNNGDLAPDIINFALTSIQSNTRGFTIERAQNVRIEQCHLESLDEGALVSTSAKNVVFDGNDFANVGHTAAVTGFCIKVIGGDAVAQNNRFSWSNASLQPDMHYICTPGGTLMLRGRHSDDGGCRSSGLSKQMNVTSATLDVGGFDHIYVNTSGIAISTIQSTLPTGAFLTLKAHNGTIRLISGGNIYFDSAFQWQSPFDVIQDSCVVLQRFDLEQQWHIVAGLPNGTWLFSRPFGCNNATPKGSFPLGNPATDLASALTLVNNIRAALMNNGIGG